MRVAGKELNFSGRVWCEQYEPKKSTLSHKTKVQFRPLAVNHIFHNTVRFVSVNGKASRVKPSKKSFEKKLEKNLEKKFWKKN